MRKLRVNPSTSHSNPTLSRRTLLQNLLGTAAAATIGLPTIEALA